MRPLSLIEVGENTGISFDYEAGTVWTYSGRKINPLNPDPDQIVIEDIAHHLSNLCRFTGATREFYSVAQHSYYCSKYEPDAYPLEKLLHDAPEYLLNDLARPLKVAPGYGELYKEMEHKLMEVIAYKFDLVYPFPTEVKIADDVLLYSEAKSLMPKDWPLHTLTNHGFSREIVGWGPSTAKSHFMRRYNALRAA